MLPIAGQMAGPNGLTFFVDTQLVPGKYPRLKKFFFWFSLKKKIQHFFQIFFPTGNAGPFN